MTLTWKKAALAALGLAVAGALVTLSGVVPIRASGGHFRAVTWFLEVAMRRSIATHAAGHTPPALDDPALVLKGAGHYELACRSCHGSPLVPTSRLARAMLPPPPDLRFAAPHWDAAELFEIVKHGIKFTGMPAWPTQRRDDEVWAMVAFLRALPGLRAEGYRRLVWGDLPRDVAAEEEPEAPPAPFATARCAPCHGPAGEGRGDAFPALAGQRESYLAASLDAYARGARHSGIMGPAASTLDADRRRALARHYAALPPPPPRPATDIASVARGERIARRGVPTSRVPACAPCHGPDAAPRNENYPLLAGQPAAYLALQLALFRRGDRGGSAYASVMTRAAHGLTEAEARDVARYYASLR
ncbi:MAG: c-type cytochrome [Polyangiales bacterium]